MGAGVWDSPLPTSSQGDINALDSWTHFEQQGPTTYLSCFKVKEMPRKVREWVCRLLQPEWVALLSHALNTKQNKLGWLFSWLTDLWYVGVLFCFLVPDEVEDEDKGKESEGGAAEGGWGSDDTVKTFSISNSCDNIAQCLLTMINNNFTHTWQSTSIPLQIYH